MVYAQPSTCPRKWHTQNPMGLWHTNGSPNLCQKTRPYNNQQKKKKKICKIVDFAVSADHRIKLKECEKRDKYLDLARELKKTMEHSGDNYTNCDWCTVTKGLLKDLVDFEVGGRVETIQTTALLKTARILGKILMSIINNNYDNNNNWHDWVDDPQGIVQDIEIWLYPQMVYKQTGIHHRELEAQSSLGFWVRNTSPNSG